MRFVRRGTTTDIRARSQMFGGEPLWAITPALPNGTGLNQNVYGNVHNQYGAETKSSPAVNMSISGLGSQLDEGAAQTIVVFNATIVGTSMTVNSITSGGNNLLFGAGTNSRLRVRSVVFNVGSEFLINSQSSGTPGGVGVYTLNSSPGNATADYRAATPLACEDGGYGLQVTTVNGKKRYRTRVAYNDNNAASQAGRKMQFRMGDNGTELSEGLGQLTPWGEWKLLAFSISIPAATKPFLAKHDNILFWQMKAGGAEISARLTFDNATSRDYGTTPPGASGTSSPRIMFRLYFGAPKVVQIVCLDNFPTDTPIHYICRHRPSVGPWESTGTNVNAEYVPQSLVSNDGGKMYIQTTAGRRLPAAGGAGPTGAGTGIVDNQCTWDYVGLVPSGNTVPETHMWQRVGTGAPTKPVTLIGLTNADAYTGTPSKNNSSWGYYTKSGGTSADTVSSLGGGTWVAGDVMELDWGESFEAPTEIARIAPTDAQIAAWFDYMHARF